jgi:hypothetical protein
MFRKNLRLESIHAIWRWRANVTPKPWYPAVRLHVVITQKTSFWRLTRFQSGYDGSGIKQQVTMLATLCLQIQEACYVVWHLQPQGALGDEHCNIWRFNLRNFAICIYFICIVVIAPWGWLQKGPKNVINNIIYIFHGCAFVGSRRQV